MKTNLYLHVGTGKTGTSAVQKFLCENRGILVDKFNVLYPDLENKNYLPRKIRGSFNTCKFLNETLGKDDYEKFENDLFKCFSFSARKNIPNIVLSCESIFHNNQWARIFSTLEKKHGIETRIILYLRRQDLYLESAWKQWGVKSKDFRTISDYYQSEITHNQMDYYTILKYWLKYFNKEQINIRIFERSSIGNDIVTDFLKQINCYNIDIWGDKINEYNNINSGFTPDVIHFLNLNKLDNIHNNRILNMLSSSLPPKYKKTDPFKSYGILTKEQRNEILYRYRLGNKEIALLFFKDRDGELFLDGHEKEGIDGNNENYDSELELVLPILMEVLLSQDKRIQKIEKKIASLSRMVPLSKNLKMKLLSIISR